MNRVIKFRGKRSDDGKWIYGYLADEDYINNINEIAMPSEEVNSDTVGQFTGRYDLRRNEIYEGDVVFWIATDMRGHGRGEQGAIIWDAHTMSWAILRDKPTVDGRPCIISRPFDKKHLEVVGNIHDNPELMERSNK